MKIVGSEVDSRVLHSNDKTNLAICSLFALSVLGYLQWKFQLAIRSVLVSPLSTTITRRRHETNTPHHMDPKTSPGVSKTYLFSLPGVLSLSDNLRYGMWEPCVLTSFKPIYNHMQIRTQSLLPFALQKFSHLLNMFVLVHSSICMFSRFQ